MPPPGERSQDWPEAAGPDSLRQPPPRMPQLTVAELRTYRRELEHAIRSISPAAPVQANLLRLLDDVVAESVPSTQNSPTEARAAQRSYQGSPDTLSLDGGYTGRG